MAFHFCHTQFTNAWIAPLLGPAVQIFHVSSRFPETEDCVAKPTPRRTSARCVPESVLGWWGMGWVEGFEPSATGTTIRRSTKLSYTHREGRFHGIREMQRLQIAGGSRREPGSAPPGRDARRALSLRGNQFPSVAAAAGPVKQRAGCRDGTLAVMDGGRADGVSGRKKAVHPSRRKSPRALSPTWVSQKPRFLQY